MPCQHTNSAEYFTLPSFVPNGGSNEGHFLEAMPELCVDPALASHLGADVVNQGSLDGVLLLKASPDAKTKLEQLTGIKLYENRSYDVTDFYPMDVEQASHTTAVEEGLYRFSFIVEDQLGQPVPNVAVLAAFGAHRSPTVYSDAAGKVTLQVAVQVIPQILVRPAKGYWSTVLFGRQWSGEIERITLTAIDLTQHERYVELLGRPEPTDGEGVKIAIIDTGVAKHRDLPNVAKRLAVSAGVIVEDALPDGIDHGTHVAGIIGCSNEPVRGHAPGAELHSYRVCNPGQRRMSTLDVVVAIADAVNAGVDIINLSLGFDSSDDAIVDLINFAHDNGVLVVAASGNNNSCKISFPANMPRVVAVSAIGRKNAYPHGSTASLVKGKGESGDYFIAGFCNVAPGQIQCSAPGVGIVSTVQEDGYLAESGTSMAAPIVTALAATLLSRHLTSLGPRTPDRLKALEDMLYTGCKQVGFHVDHVGNGIPSVR